MAQEDIPLCLLSSENEFPSTSHALGLRPPYIRPPVGVSVFVISYREMYKDPWENTRVKHSLPHDPVHRMLEDLTNG
jgi:hypothetical protein